ncbi:hypothetical protein BU17DRAFT_92146 [Hysterangium stoloniferum]|nr:hypothetical protein BU17DRAFT_92146 [Hysterangium stoloniferum]
MNNDIPPALDYAFAILDAERGSLSLIPVPIASCLIKPLTPPHQHHTCLLRPPAQACLLDINTPARFTQEHVKTLNSCRQVTLDPNELSRTLTHAKFNGIPRNCPGSRKVNLVRSLSLLGHRCDYFVSRVCPSTTSVNALDSGLAAPLACHPSPIRTISPLKKIPFTTDPQMPDNPGLCPIPLSDIDNNVLDRLTQGVHTPLPLPITRLKHTTCAERLHAPRSHANCTSGTIFRYSLVYQ